MNKVKRKKKKNLSASLVVMGTTSVAENRSEDEMESFKRYYEATSYFEMFFMISKVQAPFNTNMFIPFIFKYHKVSEKTIFI